MADTGAVRAQRHRLHKAGNHSMCKRGCGQIQAARAAAPQIPRANAGSRDFDPLAAMRDLAVQLRDACAQAPDDAVLAREYRLTLMELAKGSDGDGKDPFADLLAELTGAVPAEVGDRAH